MGKQSGLSGRRRIRGACVALAAMLVAASVGARGAAPGGVRIVRDNYGVPHVYADELGPLFYGYGYVVAEDRLFQLEMMRRSVWGTVAEALGSKYLDFDRRTRQVYATPAEIGGRMDKLAPEYQTMLKAYADGINGFIDSAAKGGAVTLPPEFDRLGIKPGRWTAVDVAQLFVGSMATRFSDGTQEMQNAALLADLVKAFGPQKGRAMFDDIVPATENPEAVTTLAPSQVWRTKAAKPSAPGGVVPRGIQEAARLVGASDEAYIAGLARLNLAEHLGSNCWVVGSKLTGNGSAILHGGPQMGFFTPGYVHEVGLHGAGFDVVGNTPAGSLPILFGHNATASWSATNGGGDVVDVFAETLDPQKPTRYKFKGEWRDMQSRDEVFKVKDGADVRETFYRTVHGPVMAIDAKEHVAYARGRSWEGLELESMAGWIDQTRAESYDAFLTASHKMAISINWYYADRKGNIGWVFTGRYPIRDDAQDRRFPTSGAGDREWRGFLAHDEVPHILNPDRGFIANWNQQPAVGFWLSNGQWGRTQHSKLLIDYLAARPTVTVDDMKALNRYASYAENNAQFFRPLLIQAVRSAASGDPELQRVAAALGAWNGLREDEDANGKYDSPGVAIFDTWLRQMFADTFTAQSVGPATSRLQNNGELLLNVLQGSGSPVKPKVDYLGGATPDAAMVASLRRAVATLKVGYGQDPAAWLAPAVVMTFKAENFLNIPQAFHQELSLLAMNRGTENHLVVLSAAGVKGVDVAPPGQSGSPVAAGVLAPHAADQLQLFATFQYKPMHFYPNDVMRAAESIKELTYRP